MHPELNEIQIISTLSENLINKLSALPQFSAKAILLADKIEARKIVNKYASRNEPILLSLFDGLCFVFPFGVIVVINLSQKDEDLILNYITPYLRHPLYSVKNHQLTEMLSISVNPDKEEGVLENIFYVNMLSRQHLELISNVLAKSIILEMYEDTIASNFEYVEPIAKNLLVKGSLNQNANELLKHIGGSLLAEHNMVGKIEIIEKPAFLWEYTQLDLLYEKLIEELEITERQKILDRKLELLSRTAQTSLEVLQHKHASRLEWYIIILIIVSIVLEGYAIFFHGIVF